MPGSSNDKNNIMNLSSTDLSENIIKFLEKGLNFIPSDDCNIRQVLIDLIKISPKLNNGDIIRLIRDRVRIRARRNVNKDIIKEFVLFLNENSGRIIITKPDKTDTIVIMDLEHYFSMGFDIIRRFDYVRVPENEIENKLTYLRNLQFETITYFNRSLNLKSNEKVNVFNNLNFRYLYLLPKIHKDKTSWINDHTPPGRPIISCHGAIFKTLETYIAKFLDEYIWKNEHWVRSAPHLTEILVRKDFYLGDYELFVADIKELYLNININTLKDKINGFLARYGVSNIWIYSEAIYTDLSNIYFLFNNNLYKMENGILMGAPFSPALAYIYLHEFDDEMLRDPNVLFYSRYIDDIFIIRKIGSNFNDDLLRPYNLTLGEFSFGQAVTFLDLHLFICPNTKKIQFGTYFKKTNNFNYVSWDSEHTQSTKKGIVISQLLRIHRTNSIDLNKFIIWEMLIRKFVKLGYGSKLLKKLLNKVFKITITPTCRQLPNKKRWQHITTHRQFDNIMRDINEMEFEDEDQIPNVSTYNARNVRKHLGVTNPASLANFNRKRFFKPPFGIELTEFPSNNPFYWTNNYPKYTTEDPKNKIRKLTGNEELERFQTISENLKTNFGIKLHRNSLFSRTFYLRNREHRR